MVLLMIEFYTIRVGRFFFRRQNCAERVCDVHVCWLNSFNVVFILSLNKNDNM